MDVWLHTALNGYPCGPALLCNRRVALFGNDA